MVVKKKRCGEGVESMLCVKHGFGPSEDFAAQTSESSFCAIILGLLTQTSVPRICCAHLGSACDLLRFATKPRASAATYPRSITHVRCLQRQNVCTIDRGFVATDG